MNWWLIGGAGALVLGIAVMVWAMGFGAVVKLLVTAFKFLVEAVTDAIDWLRKPGSKLKAVCGILALVSLTFSMLSYQRGIIIIDQREQYADLEADSAAKVASLMAELSTREQRIEQFRELARQQMALLDAQKLENAKLVADAAAARAEARKSAAKYQQVFDQRPPECSAALDVMAKACSTLRDY